MYELITRTMQKDRTYWADEPDPQAFVQRLREKRDRFNSAYESTGMRRRVERNWRYVNGGYFGSNRWGAAMARLGDQGQYAGLAVNEMRAQLSQLVAMITKAKPAVEIVGRNSDMETNRQVRNGRALVMHNIDAHEANFARVVEHALLYNVGYIKIVWDPHAGDVYDATEDGQFINSGDIVVSNPPWNSVIYDPRIQAPETLPWAIVQERVNKYDLITLYPELEEEILAASEDNQSLSRQDWSPIEIDRRDTEEWCYKYCFWHIPTPSMPLGRYAEFVGNTLLPGYEYMPTLYDKIPLIRVTAGELDGTCFGYSPLLDMQGPQEFLNATTSMIATNQKAAGVMRFWSRDEGDLDYEEIAEGLGWIRSNSKPETLDFRGNPEVYKGRDIARQDLQLMSGLNDVRRGNPEGLLKGGSGAAFALLDAKALEANSVLQASYDRAIEQFARWTLKLYNHFPQHPRVLSIPGKLNRPLQVTIQRGGFDLVENVQIKRGNPLLYTTSGRMQIVDLLARTNAVPVEYIAKFFADGDFPSLLESIMPDTSVIQDENESFLEGRAMAQALATDNHTLHIKRHAALLNTPELRLLPGFVDIVLAHIMQHVAMLQGQSGLGTVFLQQVLGYPTLGLPAPGGDEQGGGSKSKNPTASRQELAGEPSMPSPKQAETMEGTQNDSL